MDADGAIPGAVFARIDSVEHRLRDELGEQRQEQASRNDDFSKRLNDIDKQLSSIGGGIAVGKWLLGVVGLGTLANLVLHLVSR